MATRSARSKSRRKTARRFKRLRGRQSTMGRMLPAVDIRKPSQMKELSKRIKQGGLTIILVYADWCGHCHEFMPHFDAAAKSPKRSVQVAKINDSMVSNMNSAIKSINSNASPIQVDGYPSVVLVDSKGNKVKEIDAVKSTPAMTQVMEEAGNANANANGSANANASANANGSANASIRENANVNGNTESETSSSMSFNINSGSQSPYSNAEGELLNSVIAEESSSVVEPSNAASDINIKKGGSLFSALSGTAYQLAPAGVLLGIAGTTFNKRRSRKHKSHRKLTRRFKRR
jgi:thiol-disulfide isomerase/thioredoxin